MALQRKVALVTGSAKGLGKMTAMALADLGCNIAVNYVRSESAALELSRQIENKGVRSIAVKADITSRNELIRMTDKVLESLGEIDILINNAGPFVRERRFFAEYTADEIEYLIHGNLLGVMQLDHLVLPMMRKKQWGRMIHFGFGHASEARGWPHRAVYAAAKVGLVSFTKTLAEEEAANGITVNMICPGDIRGRYKETKITEASHIVEEESPRGRPGTGEDVARVIAFLCLPESDYITGNIMDISGGLDPIRTMSILKKE